MAEPAFSREPRKLKFHVFCAIPETIKSVFETGVIRKAVDTGVLRVFLHDLHALSPEPHGKIDDYPYGGGPGMILRVDVVAHALEKVFCKDATDIGKLMPVILLSPQGERFTQEMAISFVSFSEIVFICGRYEGVDERVREYIATKEVSIGDFILSGGEIAAAAVIDAVVRLIPGVVGNVESLKEESFTSGLLEYPQYTRPASFRGWKVPDVLLSGNHAEIAEWRRKKAIEVTRMKRPDLISRKDYREEI